MSHSGKKCVVIHNGSWQTIAGFSNRETPECIIPSSYIQRNDQDNSQQQIFGTFEMLDEAEKNDPNSNVYTIIDSRGLPYNWEALESQWRYIYEKQLKVDPSELPLMISVPASSSEIDVKIVQKYFELAFEKLKIPTLQIVVEPLAVALSMSKSSALVIDIGARECKVTPIIDGTVVKSGVIKSKFAGDFLDFQLTEFLKDKIPPAQSSSQMWHSSQTWIHEFKNTMLQVCDRNLVELQRLHQDQASQPHPVGFQQFTPNALSQSKNFLLKSPFAQTQTISLQIQDCLKLSEYLFQPNLAHPDFPSADGLCELISKSIRKTGATVSSLGTPSGGGNGASLTLNEKGGASYASMGGSSAAKNTGNPASTNASNPATSASNPPASGISSEQVYSILLTNVIITGSTSLLQGMEQRIVNELSIRFPHYKLTTYANQIRMDRKIQSWIATTSMSNLPTWELGKWFSAADYEFVKNCVKR